MRIELLYPEDVIMQEIEGGEVTRDDVAETYAYIWVNDVKADWGKINRVIVQRWSRNALKYIKKKAWKMVVEGIVNQYKDEYEERNE